MFAHEVLQLVGAVGLSLYGYGRVQGGGDVDVVVPVYPEYVFNHVAGALHVDPVGRNGELYSVGAFFENFHFEVGYDVLYRIFFHVPVYVVVLEVYDEIFRFFFPCRAYLHGYFAPGKFLCHQSGLFEGIYLSVGVNAAFETEARVGRKAVAACAFPYPRGIEVCAFEEYVGCGVVFPRAFASEYSGNTHGVFGVADCEVLI